MQVLLWIDAPRYPALCAPAERWEAKKDLLKLWQLPLLRFPAVFHWPEGSPVVAEPCCPTLDALTFWMEVWLATDEDLHFAPVERAPTEDAKIAPQQTTTRFNTGDPRYTCCSCYPRCRSYGWTDVCSDWPLSWSPTLKRAALIELKTFMTAVHRLCPALQPMATIWLRKFSDLLNSHVMECLAGRTLACPSAGGPAVIAAQLVPLQREEQQPERTRVEDFLEEAASSGVDLPAKFSSFTKIRNGSCGTGIFAAAYISAGTPVAAIHVEQTISIFTALEDPLFGPRAVKLLACNPEYRPRYADKDAGDLEVRDLGPTSELLDTDAVLLLFIIFDKFLNPDLPPNRHAYWSSLPSYEDPANQNLMLAPPEVLDFLDEDEATAAVQNLLGHLYRLFCLFQTTVFKTDPEFFPAETFSWNNLLWARWVIDTRGMNVRRPVPTRWLVSAAPFENAELSPVAYPQQPGLSLEPSADYPPQTDDSVGNGLPQQIAVVELAGVVLELPDRATHLMPGLDLFNHHPVGHVRLPRYDELTQNFVVTADAAVATGGEVFMSYGPCESWQLLVYYGFCPRDEDGVNWPLLDTILVAAEDEENEWSFILRSPYAFDPAMRHGTDELDGFSVCVKAVAAEDKFERLRRWKNPGNADDDEEDEDVPLWVEDWGERLLTYFHGRREFLRHILPE